MLPISEDAMRKWNAEWNVGYAFAAATATYAMQQSPTPSEDASSLPREEEPIESFSSSNLPRRGWACDTCRKGKKGVRTHEEFN